MVTERPYGPDVSHYQGTVDWVQAKASGVSFAACKATEGLTRRGEDNQFSRNWPAMYKAGIRYRIAYHYAHIENSPIEEARHFVSFVLAHGKIGRGDFLALDAEDVCPASKRISPLATAKWCEAWLDEVVRLTGLKRSRILVYTGDWWWIPRTNDSDLPAKAGHPLWLSAYTGESRLSPAPWRTWRFWQYTNGTNPKQNAAGTKFIPGIGHCDVSQFNGSLRGLWWLSGFPVKLFGRK